MYILYKSFEIPVEKINEKNIYATEATEKPDVYRSIEDKQTSQLCHKLFSMKHCSIFHLCTFNGVSIQFTLLRVHYKQLQLLRSVACSAFQHKTVHIHVQCMLRPSGYA